MSEPLWSPPERVRGIWWTSVLMTPSHDRIRCQVAVSPKGEIDVIRGSLLFPGAVGAVVACAAAAQRPPDAGDDRVRPPGAAPWSG